jgi:hypothetical protein
VSATNAIVEIGANACVENFSCVALADSMTMTSVKVAAGSCIGEDACEEMGSTRDNTHGATSVDVGVDSCIGAYACFGAKVTFKSGQIPAWGQRHVSILPLKHCRSLWEIIPVSEVLSILIYQLQ